MRTFGAETLLAFDATGVAGVVVTRGLGRRRVRAFARVPLSAGVLVPTPFDPNVLGGEEVRTALRHLGESLQPPRAEAVLLLPGGIARLLLLEPPPGAVPRDYARFRLGASLPYPAGEAVVDVLRLPAGRALAAAVRRSIVEGYEAVAAAAGFVSERVDLVPLAAMAGLTHSAGPATADVVLGDAAVSLAVSTEGTLRVFRSRRRAPGPDEGRRLGDELARSVALAAPSSTPPVRVVGPGAGVLIEELGAAGWTVRPGWDGVEAGLPVRPEELPWWGALVS